MKQLLQTVHMIWILCIILQKEILVVLWKRIN